VVVYGARLKVKDGEHVKLGPVAGRVDPYTYSILTEIGGTVQFKDLQEGITLNEEVDRSHRPLALGGCRCSRRKAPSLPSW